MRFGIAIGDFFSDIGDFFTEDVGGFFSDAVDWVSDIPDMIGDAIKSAFEYVLENVFYRFFYLIVAGLCKLVGYLDELFKVLSGQTNVKYNGEPAHLLDVFFNNHTIGNIYWGFALLGVVLAFAAAMIAVARKMFDGRDKDQRSLGGILGSLAKSLLLIVSMNAIMVVLLNFTSLLMTQITYIFDYAEVLDQKESIVFTDEQYAAMGRVLNTIANYSLSESSTSTYNINTCFNEIRADMYYLQKQGVFDFYYETKKDGVKIDTWQSMLQDIAHSANLRKDLYVDVYYEGVASSIKNAMNILRTNRNVRPLSQYKREFKAKTETIPLDRFLFVMGTFDAAKNSDYNVNPELTDGLRSAYYYGYKDIYDFDVCKKDFSFAPGDYSYLLTLLVGIIMLINLYYILFSCTVRIFLLLFLYIVGPLFFAVEPIDDGEKRKQWTQAFVVQLFSVYGTVITMRLVLIVIPIILSSNLVLFDSGFMNFLAKVVLVISCYQAAKKANSITTGILSGNAAMASVMATQGAARASAMQTWSTMTAPARLAKYGYDKAKQGAQAAGGAGGAGGGGGGAGGGGGSRGGGGGGGSSFGDDVSKKWEELKGNMRDRSF